GEAGDGPEALLLLQEKHPDIAVLDIAMPGMNGLEVIRASRGHGFPGEFVVLTMYKEEAYLDEALDLGVAGYLLKDSAAADLLTCLCSVAQGRFFLCPSLSDHLVWRTTQHDALSHELPTLRLLSPMEMKVLRLIAAGKTSRNISEELGISIRTVQNHRTHICTKLGFAGHNRLLQFALQHKSLL
ncbi:MAG TPA: response regulator transcription factor, partial [Bacteroidota bacterium]|nr:response regulator transcription factor [Bacteroidota bacterium]